MHLTDIAESDRGRKDIKQRTMSLYLTLQTVYQNNMKRKQEQQTQSQQLSNSKAVTKEETLPFSCCLGSRTNN